MMKNKQQPSKKQLWDKIRSLESENNKIRIAAEKMLKLAEDRAARCTCGCPNDD